MLTDINTHLWEKKHIIDDKFTDEAIAARITRKLAYPDFLSLKSYK